MSEAQRTRLIEIIRERSFRNDREFKLSSGKTSRRYFNLKPTMMDPEGAACLADVFLEEFGEEAFDAVGGLEMGAVPFVCAVAPMSHVRGRPLPAFFVRKAQKGYGADELIEGLPPGETLQGKRCLVVDDVTTTGGSSMKAVEAVKAAGGTVDTVAVIVDREEGAAAFFEEQGLSFRPLIKASEVDPDGEPAR